MKNVMLSLSMLCLFATTVQSQRLDEMRFSHTYLQLPSAPLQGDFQTYDILINKGTLKLAKMGMIESSLIENNFNLSNYTYSPGGGDFLIVVNLDGDHYVAKELKKSTKTQGRGDNAKKVTVYSYEVKFRIPITYQILDGKREVMVDEIFSGYDRHFTRSFGEARSTSGLEKNWENSGQATFDAWVKEAFAEQMRALGNQLASRYDTRPVNRPILLYGIKKADKIGYEKMAAAVPALQAVIESATAEQALTLDDFGENISLWEAALQNAAASDKKESVAFQAAAYNLAVAHTISGNPDQGMAFMQRLAEPGRRDWMARALEPIILDAQERLAANENVPNTFHATYDAAADEAYRASQATPPATPVAEETYPDDFVVLQEGVDTLYGVLAFDYKKLRGSEEAMTLQGIELEDATQPNQAKRYLKPEEFLFIRSKGIILIPVEASFGPWSLVTLQEPIHFTDGLVLSRWDEGNREYVYCLTHLETNRKGEKVKRVYNLDEGLAFLNLNRGLAKKFAGCATIVNKATAESYERNETSYRQIVNDYATCNDNP